MLIGLATGEEGGGEQESHSKVGTLLGPTKIYHTRLASGQDPFRPTPSVASLIC